MSEEIREIVFNVHGLKINPPVVGNVHRRVSITPGKESIVTIERDAETGHITVTIEHDK